MGWYCGNESSITHPWIDEGLSPCFISTVVTSLLFGISVVFGGLQILFYRKYSTPLGSHLVPRKSCLYGLQLFTTLALAIQAVVKVMLHALVLYDKSVAVYQIIEAVLQSLAWLVSIALICLERKRMLPSIPTRGHGLILLLLWTFAFGGENIAFLSWASPLWWWEDRDFSKNVDLGMWIWRYVGTAVLFILGFLAPGLPSSNYSDLMLIDQRLDEEQVLINTNTGEGSSGDASTSSRAEGRGFGESTAGTTWRGLLQKSLKLWPYMWPKKSPWLQLCVVVCMVLLAAGRVVNLYTPIMYKLIVDSMTIQNGSQVLVTNTKKKKVPTATLR